MHQVWELCFSEAKAAEMAKEGFVDSLTVGGLVEEATVQTNRRLTE